VILTSGPGCPGEPDKPGVPGEPGQPYKENDNILFQEKKIFFIFTHRYTWTARLTRITSWSWYNTAESC
jgi:hypothetical protein